MSSAWDESSCYRPRVIPAGKAGCLLEKPLKINRFDANVGASQKTGNVATRRAALNRAPVPVRMLHAARQRIGRISGPT
ncbi:hypothetical protein EGJ28_17940 [Stutzerimonas xanthomarina]|uniref:Uncharacterized protein n=1 Tax=Stutzerimonas xanthomarina TaxID=271420 RepID=A0A098FYL4_9GAMM|nr:hypothetical protein CXK98_17330 [Stutzerimonas kunmingensis]RRU93767.1 hypothetical protein EGI97_13800 [Stutzerimonas xanthomarina]TVT66686.1 MAG: hypothetical protein FHK79_16070 [Pseudomonas sp.]RRV07859.1 hypothetical protein EGJ28_17940 [Stutzerimonas xanthomarina]CEG54320.1 hypothetical protein PXNS11_350040 [Stutzerimonas xanthomarina]